MNAVLRAGYGGCVGYFLLPALRFAGFFFAAAFRAGFFFAALAFFAGLAFFAALAAGLRPADLRLPPAGFARAPPDGRPAGSASEPPPSASMSPAAAEIVAEVLGRRRVSGHVVVRHIQIVIEIVLHDASRSGDACPGAA